MSFSVSGGSISALVALSFLSDLNLGVLASSAVGGIRARGASLRALASVNSDVVDSPSLSGGDLEIVTSEGEVEVGGVVGEESPEVEGGLEVVGVFLALSELSNSLVSVVVGELVLTSSGRDVVDNRVGDFPVGLVSDGVDSGVDSETEVGREIVEVSDESGIGSEGSDGSEDHSGLSASVTTDLLVDSLRSVDTSDSNLNLNLSFVLLSGLRGLSNLGSILLGGSLSLLLELLLLSELGSQLLGKDLPLDLSLVLSALEDALSIDGLSVEGPVRGLEGLVLGEDVLSEGSDSLDSVSGAVVGVVADVLVSELDLLGSGSARASTLDEVDSVVALSALSAARALSASLRARNEIDLDVLDTPSSSTVSSINGEGELALAVADGVGGVEAEDGVVGLASVGLLDLSFGESDGEVLTVVDSQVEVGDVGAGALDDSVNDEDLNSDEGLEVGSEVLVGLLDGDGGRSEDLSSSEHVRLSSASGDVGVVDGVSVDSPGVDLVGVSEMGLSEISSLDVLGSVGALEILDGVRDAPEGISGGGEESSLASASSLSDGGMGSAGVALVPSGAGGARRSAGSGDLVLEVSDGDLVSRGGGGDSDAEATVSGVGEGEVGVVEDGNLSVVTADLTLLDSLAGGEGHGLLDSSDEESVGEVRILSESKSLERSLDDGSSGHVLEASGEGLVGSEGLGSSEEGVGGTFVNGGAGGGSLKLPLAPAVVSDSLSPGDDGSVLSVEEGDLEVGNTP